MRELIDYIRSCFCKHEWEMIFDTEVHDHFTKTIYNTFNVKIYRCKKCGYSKKYKSY